MSNFEQFNAYGQFSVNETLQQSANVTAGVSSVTYGFPAAFAGHIVALSAYAIVGTTKSSATVSQGTGTNNTVLLTVSLSSPLISSNSSSVHLGFYVVDSFSAYNASDYNVPILFYPSVNMKIDNISSEIFLPSSSYDNQEPALTSLLQAQAFSQTVNGSAVIYNGSANNASLTNPSSSTAQVYIDPAQGGAVDFASIQRQISVGSDGSVTVRDTLTVRNHGLNTITKLNYVPITNSSTVTLQPSSIPPLSNVENANVSSGVLTLSSFNDNIEPNSAVTIIIQYPISSSYLSTSNGATTVKIPTDSPVSAITDNFVVTVKSPAGVDVTGQTSASATNSTGLSATFSFSFKNGIGSAYASAIPVAALIFIAVFLGVVIFKPKAEQEEDVVTIYDSLIRAVEDKVTSTNDILGELKARGNTITRNDLTAARPRIDELKTKSSGRIGVLRSQVTSPSVTVQSALNQVAANDREFDRDVRDLLNVYDQFISRKIKEDTFRRVLQTNERRMQSVTNSFLDSVHDLREEYEAEA